MPSLADQILDQYTFRLTGSIPAAVIALNHRVTTLVQYNPYEHIISASRLTKLTKTN